MFGRTKHRNWFSIKRFLRQPNSLNTFSFFGNKHFRKICIFRKTFYSKQTHPKVKSFSWMLPESAFSLFTERCGLALAFHSYFLLLFFLWGQVDSLSLVWALVFNKYLWNLREKLNFPKRVFVKFLICINGYRFESRFPYAAVQLGESLIQSTTSLIFV